MARPFKLDKADDRDLNLLINDFLERKPDYLPMSLGDGTLILMPCSDGRDMEEFARCPETPSVVFCGRPRPNC